MQIHVRDIISKLSYTSLVEQRIIPDVKSMLQPAVLVSKRYPPFVYAGKDFSFFGMYMDFVIRAGLRIKLQQTVHLGTEPVEHMSTHLYQNTTNMNDVASSSLQLVSAMYGTTPYSKEQMYSYVATTVNIMKELVAQWIVYQYYLQGTVRYNTVFTYKSIMGHPDIITDNCVLDIKTTASFGKMSSDACLQVLAYYALMKHNNVNVRYLGFVLPMQRLVVVYDMGNWHCDAYLQLLNSTAEGIINSTFQAGLQAFVDLPGNQKVTIGTNNTTLDISELEQLQQTEYAELAMTLQLTQLTPSYLNECRVGAHISKGTNLSKTLQNYVNSAPNRPCQLFLRNPRTGVCASKTVQQLAGARAIIDKYQLQCYIHAAYVINLCANECDGTGANADYWQQRYLNEDLIFANKMGCRGVVVHTGNRLKLTEEAALSVMEHMIRNALPHATEYCPLLLETPCGEGTEVCTTIEELGNFLFRFTDEELKKIGLCVDTCHIYAKKYIRPLAYLQHWKRYGPVPIRLVHLNDSKDDCCSCVDHHAFPGVGRIGEVKMKEVAYWCEREGIPMVLE